MSPKTLRGRLITAFAIIYLVWGSTYLAIRFAVEELPPFLLAGARFVVAGALLYAWSRARGAERPRAAHWRSAALLGVLMLTLGNGAVVWAQKRVPSGLAAVLIATVPFWMVFFEWLRDRSARPGRAVLLGVAAGLAGVALLVAPKLSLGQSQVDAMGALALLSAPVGWSAGSILMKRAALPRFGLMGTATQMLCGGAALLVLSLVLEDWSALEPASVSLRAWLALGYLVVFGSLVALSAYGWLIQNAPPARVATYAYVNPVVALFLGWAVAGETLGTRSILAVALILGAVVLITTFRARRPKAAPAPVPVPGPGPASAALRR